MAHITEKQKLFYSSNEECMEVAYTCLTVEKDGQLYTIGREGESSGIVMTVYSGNS